MGFEFKTEQERNPVSQATPEPTELESLRKRVEMYENFLNDNGYGVLFDTYVEMIEGKISKEDYRNFTGDVEFEIID